MANYKIDPLDKKTSFSVRAGIKSAFIDRCKELDLNHNDVAEALLQEFVDSTGL